MPDARVFEDELFPGEIKVRTDRSSLYKNPVRAATTANIALSGLQTVDGVALAASDRVLVKNQTTASENGIYIAASGAWTRADDADSDEKVRSGLVVPVREGAMGGGRHWILTVPDPIIVGATSLAFRGSSKAATFVVDPGGQGDFTTLQAALDALPSGGGSIFVKGQHSVSTTINLPDKHVKIVGDGDATIFDAGANAIAIFTSAFDRVYIFQDFQLKGNGSADQAGFRFTGNLSRTFVPEWRNVNINPAIAGAGLRKGIQYTGTSGYAALNIQDCDWYLSQVSTARYIEGAGTMIVEVYAAKTFFLMGGVTTGGGFSTHVTLIASQCYLDLHATGSFRKVLLANCIIVNLAAITPTDVDNIINGCLFTGVTPVRHIDFTAAVIRNVVSNCVFSGSRATSEEIRIASSANVITGNVQAKITEIGAANNNLYSGNTGFSGSTVLGSGSRVVGQDIGCRVFHNANQSIANASNVALAFNSERYDTDGMHDPATNNSRITIPIAGKYVISALVTFASNGTGLRYVFIRKNGTTTIGGAMGLPVTEAGVDFDLPVSVIDSFVKGDYVEVVVQQRSGAALNVETHPQYSPEFAAHLMS